MNTSSIPFTCDPTVNHIFEVSKYIGTLGYLGIGGYLHFRILQVVLGKRRKQFGDSSFFRLFATDSVASISLILTDLLFNRFFSYISPLCPIVGPFFYEPSLIMKAHYQIAHHSRFAKSVAQIFMVLNRMSCVLMPIEHVHIWKKLTPISIILVAILPIGGTWNIFISRTYGQPLYGGFATNYIRTVQWAALSLFQSIYILTALFFTIFCTSITLYKLFSIPDRIKSIEKSLCQASFGISITFLLVAVTQLLFAFCLPCHTGYTLYIAQSLAFDTFTIGSAIVMIATNNQLRDAIFPSKRRKSVTVVTVHLSS